MQGQLLVELVWQWKGLSKEPLRALLTADLLVAARFRAINVWIAFLPDFPESLSIWKHNILLSNRFKLLSVNLIVNYEVWALKDEVGWFSDKVWRI